MYVVERKDESGVWRPLTLDRGMTASFSNRNAATRYMDVEVSAYIENLPPKHRVKMYKAEEVSTGLKCCTLPAKAYYGIGKFSHALEV